MSNSLSYGAISQIYLSGSSERFVASNSGDYYWWNDFNRSYQPIDTSSLNGFIIGVDSDNTGNLVFLTLVEGPVDGSGIEWWLTTWNASSQSLEVSQPVYDAFDVGSVNPPFAYISST